MGARQYDFPKRVGSGSITGGTPVTYTFTASGGGCPFGVNGSDSNHYLHISGGTGTAETPLITGGTCIGGAVSGTVTFTPTFSHSGAWILTSATFGIYEAAMDLPASGGTIDASLATSPEAFVSVRIPKPVHLILPPGIVTLHGSPGLVLSVANSTVEGSSSQRGTVLLSDHDGADIFQFASSGIVSLRNITIRASGVRTGGAGVHISGGEIDCENVTVEPSYIGYLIDSASGSFHNCNATPSASTPAAANWYAAVVLRGAAGSVTTDFQWFRSIVSIDRPCSAGGCFVIDGNTDTIHIYSLEVIPTGYCRSLAGTGTVDTNGVNIIRDSGLSFVTDGSWSGKLVHISGVAYLIDHVTDADHLVLDASEDAGIHAASDYDFANFCGASILVQNTIMGTDNPRWLWCFACSVEASLQDDGILITAAKQANFISSYSANGRRNLHVDVLGGDGNNIDVTWSGGTLGQAEQQNVMYAGGRLVLTGDVDLWGASENSPGKYSAVEVNGSGTGFTTFAFTGMHFRNKFAYTNHPNYLIHEALSGIAGTIHDIDFGPSSNYTIAPILDASTATDRVRGPFENAALSAYWPNPFANTLTSQSQAGFAFNPNGISSQWAYIAANSGFSGTYNGSWWATNQKTDFSTQGDATRSTWIADLGGGYDPITWGADTWTILRQPAGGALAKLFQVDSAGNVTAAGAINGVVDSITGTANQVTASAATGAVTLSLPSNINVNAYPLTYNGAGTQLNQTVLNWGVSNADAAGTLALTPSPAYSSSWTCFGMNSTGSFVVWRSSQNATTCTLQTRANADLIVWFMIGD